MHLPLGNLIRWNSLFRFHGKGASSIDSHKLTIFEVTLQLVHNQVLPESSYFTHLEGFTTMLPLKPIIHIGNPCFQATLEALSDPAFESFLLPSAEKVLKTGEAITEVSL